MVLCLVYSYQVPSNAPKLVNISVDPGGSRSIAQDLWFQNWFFAKNHENKASKKHEKICIVMYRFLDSSVVRAHTGLFCQISFGNSNFGKTYFFNIFLLETLQDIWYFDILRKKEFFYISNYHIYWLELSYFYHFCSFQHFYLVTQVKDFDINPL